MVSDNITDRHGRARTEFLNAVKILVIFPEVHCAEGLFKAINVNVSHVGVILEEFRFEGAFKRTTEISGKLFAFFAAVDGIDFSIGELELVNLNHNESLSLSDYSYILADSSEMSSANLPMVNDIRYKKNVCGNSLCY